MSESKNSSIANAKNFIRDTKKPLIFIGVIVVGSLVYTLTAHHAQPVNKASIADAPNTTGRMGDPVSPEYQKNIDISDQKRLADANRTGDSFMETLTPHSGGDHSLSPNLDDSAESGGGGDKALPDLPDAQPHMDAPAPPPVTTLPPATVSAPKAPRRYVSKERIAELQKQLSERVNNNVAAQEVVYSWKQDKGADSSLSTSSGGGRTEMASATPGAGKFSGGSDASLRAAAMKGPGASSGTSSDISFEVPDPGTIIQSHFLSLTDSRIPGMVLAVVDEGPYRGARVLGRFTVADQANKLMFQFTKLVVPYEDDSGVKRAKVMSINAVAVDPDTLTEGLATYVNTHMFARVASTLATSFMQGLGQAVQQSGSTATYTASGGTIVSQGEKNLTQEMFQAGGQSASQIGAMLGQIFGATSKTIKEDQNVSFGLLFVGNNT